MPDRCHAAARLAICVCALAAPAPTASAQGRGAGGVALVGATVVDVAGAGDVRDATILVSGGRIVRVFPSANERPPRGARVVDIRGKFVIPGLWDMHVEQALPFWERLPVDSNAALHHPLLLAHGVTGVRDVAGPLGVLGRWQREIEQGVRLGPRMVFTGPKFSERATNATRQVVAVSELSAAVAAHARNGAHAIYISDLPPSLHAPLLAAAGEAGLAVEGNVPLGISLWDAASRGQRVVDHFDGFFIAAADDELRVRRSLRWNEDPPWWLRTARRLRLDEPIRHPWAFALQHWSDERASGLVAHLARHRTYQVPTVRMLGTLLRSGDSLVRLPPSPLSLRPARHPWQEWASEPVSPDHPMAREWTALLAGVGAMQRAGVPILAGSDAPNLHSAPGRSLHDELGLLVRAGLTPREALRAATLTPAEYLGATDSLGTVAPGRVADLVILEGDPTRDIGNTRRIAAVMTRGRLLERATLDSLLRAGTDRARQVEAYWIERQGTAR